MQGVVKKVAGLENCSLSLTQQSNLMKEIAVLADIEGEDEALDMKETLVEFLHLLEGFSFITPDKRAWYMSGIDDAMSRRKKRQEGKNA